MDEPINIYDDSGDTGSNDIQDLEPITVQIDDETINMLNEQSTMSYELQETSLSVDEQILEQMLLQTQYELMMVGLLFFITGIYLFKWAVKLWKRSLR